MEHTYCASMATAAVFAFYDSAAEATDGDSTPGRFPSEWARGGRRPEGRRRRSSGGGEVALVKMRVIMSREVTAGTADS